MKNLDEILEVQDPSLNEKLGLLDESSVKKNKTLRKYSGITVWEVNGEEVRAKRDIDFTDGGNYGKYRFMPKNEIWVDSDLDKNPSEQALTIVHELIEYNKMIKDGTKYIDAHDTAATVELLYRLKINKDIEKRIKEECAILAEQLKEYE